MEVYFVDVGQGTSNVILLGGRRAIVIDTGKRAADLTKLLHHFHVSELACLVLSHLDNDHAGCAPAMLTAFRGAVEKVCYPTDHRIHKTPFWEKLQDELDRGHLEAEQLCRLECQDRPKLLWRSTATKAELKIFSPTFGVNQLAMGAEDANATSGVLVLTVGDRRVVFPGDSTVGQWREIRSRLGKPLDCDVIAVPHHAGVIWPGHWEEAQARAEMQWLYADAVRPGFAVVSVGTSNEYGHPRSEVMETLRTLGVRILCSQITSRCASPLEALRPGVISMHLPGRSSRSTLLTSAGNSKDLACAGTVGVEIGPDSLTVQRWRQHRAAVNRLPTVGSSSPMCR
jgi:competence protein ComEC